MLSFVKGNGMGKQQKACMPYSLLRNKIKESKECEEQILKDEEVHEQDGDWSFHRPKGGYNLQF